MSDPYSPNPIPSGGIPFNRPTQGLAFKLGERSAGLQTTDAVVGEEVGRKHIVIQNHAAAVLYVKLGTGCTTSDFDMIIKACSVAGDGTVPPMDIAGYDGPVSVKATGTPSYSFFSLL